MTDLPIDRTSKTMLGVNPRELHSWRSAECGGACERVYKADDVDAEIERLREALKGFIDFQISDYDRMAGMAKRYCELRKAARKLLSGEPSAVETNAPVTHSPEPSAYLKLWDQNGPRRRVDLSADCEPWLQAQRPIITPLYARLPSAVKANEHPGICTCPGGTPNSKLGFHNECRLHGLAAQRAVKNGTPEEEADWAEFGDCPRCWKCGAPVITVPGCAPGCIRNCPPSPVNGDCNQT